MFTAADLIEVLRQRRRLKSIRPEVPGQLPPGWQAWLDAMPAREGAVVGALPQAVVDALLERPLLQPPRRVGNLNRWQAFATLWRQQWHAPEREERGVRWFAAGTSGALHLLFLAMLMWLAYVRIALPPPAAEGDNVVLVEFIGRGTPEETGGGAPTGAEPEPEIASAPPAAAPRAEPLPQPVATREPVDAPPDSQPPPEVAQPEPAPVPVPPAPQPLQVTEVPEPDIDFVLPPPKPREVALPQADIAVPEVRQPTPRIAEVEVPRPSAVQVERPRQALVRPTPQIRAEPEPQPEPEARMPQVRVQALREPAALPELRVPEARAQVREIPMPDLGEAPAAEQTAEASAPSRAAADAPSASAAPAGGPPAPASGATPTATRAGDGPDAAKPGAWPTPARSDDWGAATRNRPGGAPAGRSGDRPGIYDSDGTPRLVDEPAPGRNAPGTVEQRIADLDRAGQWLKRPPYDYAPTTFEKYWRPHETLLQEWVRKGIRKLSIPIPGTDKRLVCVVSMLQFGGGCGLADPNLNEQPASARPPPDIPFKPELQEDNGSVRPQPPAS